MQENVPHLDIILLQSIASMVVNNQLFISTQEKCALNLNSLLFHMSHELDNLSQDTVRNLIGSKEADAQLACKLALDIPVTNDVINCFIMGHDHPSKLVLTLLNVSTLCCQSCLL